MSGETKIKYRYLLTPAKGSSSALTNAIVHDPSFDWEGTTSISRRTTSS